MEGVGEFNSDEDESDEEDADHDDDDDIGIYHDNDDDADDADEEFEDDKEQKVSELGDYNNYHERSQSWDNNRNVYRGDGRPGIDRAQSWNDQSYRDNKPDNFYNSVNDLTYRREEERLNQERQGWGLGRLRRGRGRNDLSFHSTQSGKMVGFGTPAPDFTNPRTLREMLLTFRTRMVTSRSEFGMKKMKIGDSDGRRNWAQRIEGLVDAMVDAGIPQPELDGYVTSTSREVTAAPKEFKKTNETGSFMRREFNDDNAYIIYLEGELMASELEIGSYKNRVKELEIEVKQLKGHGKDDDSSVSSSDSSHIGRKVSEESEIEWETSVATEGVLIDIDGNGSDEDARKSETEMIKNEAFGNESEGILIDLGSNGDNGDPKTLSTSIVRAKASEELRITDDDDDSGADSNSRADFHSSSSDENGSTVDNSHTDRPVAEGTLLDLTDCDEILVRKITQYHTQDETQKEGNMFLTFDEQKESREGTVINLVDPSQRALPDILEGEGKKEKKGEEGEIVDALINMIGGKTVKVIGKENNEADAALVDLKEETRAERNDEAYVMPFPG
jgi:hypothetical protein